MEDQPGRRGDVLVPDEDDAGFDVGALFWQQSMALPLGVYGDDTERHPPSDVGKDTKDALGKASLNPPSPL